MSATGPVLIKLADLVPGLLAEAPVFRPEAMPVTGQCSSYAGPLDATGLYPGAVFFTA